MAAGVSIDLIGREIEVGGQVGSYWVQFASPLGKTPVGAWRGNG